MRNLVFCMALLSSCLLDVANAQQLTDITYGKGVNLLAADSSFSMKFNYRMQNLLIAEMPSDYSGIEDVSANWLVRRSRLKFSGFAYTPRLKYKIELGLSNRDHGGESPETGEHFQFDFGRLFQMECVWQLRNLAWPNQIAR